ncbi:unnamed protein product [Ranitomeya imitator]|uniref:Uncharacterized protein n=1 Tax=Ranitomeya imitator TaxID=111125 RepID=A0ABN9MCN6_9NEOB|nr:unnamed protein product [Ranitomeya imitator]
MSAAGVGPLCFIKGRVNAASYQEILEHFMLPLAEMLYGDEDFIFQHDLAPAHSAKTTGKWFTDHGITVLNWPANSPDLNPIENLWDIVKRKLRDARPNTLDELKATIEASWASITSQQCHRLIASMPRRIEAVISSKDSRPMFTVAKKIRELMADNENMNAVHESHEVFRREQDEQLVQWMNSTQHLHNVISDCRRPDDWTLSAGGSGTIYGWGHNHRGQLGGIEGAKVKVPTPCEALATLRPVQLIGGEQTLFAVTADGKLYATGYGAGGRLGIGGTESVSTPTLLESIQHVFVKKVAVNSGGKHCLALSSEGEVYSWGEAEDGKLGHGNRSPCDRPRVIESLRGTEVIDIAAGGAHSACITAAGELYTWGKGRYGRLGHGDSEDQLKPKLVEALQGYRVIDIACGSGDAQTLCLTDDDTVWSWGDGDYGKLGRGGSDGCKVPMKIDSLTGLGVTKVECGSQFSVALTKSGAVYTCFLFYMTLILKYPYSAGL